MVAYFSGRSDGNREGYKLLITGNGIDAVEDATTITLTSPGAAVGLEATVAMFQANPATGTGYWPARINDNDTGTIGGHNAVGEYIEVDFGKVVYIKRWRQYGEFNNGGDGRWKIQYYNLATHAWTDWVTGLATRSTRDWSGYSTVTEVLTDKIRSVCEVVDTFSGAGSQFREIEVIY
ncbi:hypothetical protein LCGC14_0405830 [marine sediment metagenome]|uniref:F5/8 type C domain-containing protein n=1 Tax=marine sediment metagenome TaxID=412755 RepID=A0A0F9T0W0_9ZZZZ